MAALGLSRRFWIVWTAGTISFLGDGMLYGAMPLLAVSLTRDSRLIALVEALETSGWLLLGLVSGVVADRVTRLRLMWLMDALRLPLLALLTWLILTGQVTMPAVFVISFLLGLVAPFFDNASSAVVPDLVGDEHLERANALMQGSLSLGTNLLGPPLGAVAFTVAAALPFGIDAASFAAAAVLVAVVARRAPRPEPPASRSLWGDLREGFAFLAGHRVLRALALAIGVVNAVTVGMTAVFVLFVVDELGLPDTTYGAFYACLGLGGLLGAVVAGRISGRLGPRWTVQAALVAFAVSVLAIAGGRAPWLIAVALMLGGGAGMVWNVVSMSYRQRVTPPQLLGRVTSVVRMVAFVAMPAGAVAAGFSVHAVGLRPTFLIGGLLLVLTAIVSFPALRGMPGRAAVAAQRAPVA